MFREVNATNYYYKDLEDRMARDRMVSIFLTSFLHILVNCWSAASHQVPKCIAEADATRHVTILWGNIKS